MSKPSSFADLLHRARGQDREAAAELLRRYEPAIRRAVRLRLQNPQLRRVFDSMDVCQSVLGNFFARLARGEWELEGPEHLVRLLVRLARRKLIDKVRAENAAIRGGGRVRATYGEHGEEPSPGPDPGEQVADRDWLEHTLALLTDEERQILELRDQDQDWCAIAAVVGGTPGGVRKKWERTRERLQKNHGLVG